MTVILSEQSQTSFTEYYILDCPILLNSRAFIHYANKEVSTKTGQTARELSPSVSLAGADGLKVLPFHHPSKYGRRGLGLPARWRFPGLPHS